VRFALPPSGWSVAQQPGGRTIIKGFCSARGLTTIGGAGVGRGLFMMYACGTTVGGAFLFAVLLGGIGYGYRIVVAPEGVAVDTTCFGLSLHHTGALSDVVTDDPGLWVQDAPGGLLVLDQFIPEKGPLLDRLSTRIAQAVSQVQVALEARSSGLRQGW
jgi:hypothetical protein